MKHENFDLLLSGRVQACITSEHCFHIEFLEAYNKHKRMSKNHHTLGFLNQTTHTDQLSKATLRMGSDKVGSCFYGTY